MTFYDKELVKKMGEAGIQETQNLMYQSLNEVVQEEFSDWGFEPKQFNKVELFQLKHFQMDGYPSNEYIRCFAINEQNIVILTKSQRIYRQRFEEDPECVEIDIPLNEGDKFGRRLLQLGGQVGKHLGEGIQSMKSAFKRQSTMKLRMRTNELVESKLEKVFLEPSGKHLMICSDSGESFHLRYDQFELRALSHLKGKVVKFVLWDQSPTTKSFIDTLIVTQENKFYLFSLIWDEEKDKQVYEENISRSIFQLPTDRVIYQIEKIVTKTTLTLIISTDQSIIILSGSFDHDLLLSKYKEPETLRKVEVPQPKSFDTMGTMINICYSKETLQPSTMIWTNGHSLQQYKFPSVQENLNQQFLYNSTALKYSKKFESEPSQAYSVNETIYGVGLSKFHYYLLTFDTLTIISVITQKVVQYYDLVVKTMGNAIGMTFDRASDCFWIYCAHGVYKLDTSAEDMEAWKILVERKMFDEAIKIAQKYDSPFQKHIAGLYADDLFLNHNYMEASKQYRLSSRSFEEIFLQFLVHDDPKSILALEHFLKDIQNQQKMNHQGQILQASILELMVVRLKNYQRMSRQTITTQDQELPEQALIIQVSNNDQDQENRSRKSDSLFDCQIFQNSSNSYDNLCELLIRKTSGTILKKKSGSDQFKEISKNLKLDVDKMLQEFSHELDQDLIYQILQPHGFFDECVNFAIVKQNYKMAITNYINNEEHPNVVNKLKKIQDVNLILNLIIKYSYILVKTRPKDIFDIIINVVKKFDPSKLIGTILNVPDEQHDLAINFLEHCINNLQCSDKIVNNLLIYKLTKPPNIDKIMPYLQKAEKLWKESQKINFDLQFAQRLFKDGKLLRPQIAVLALQGNYDEAVSLALKNNLLQVAKEFANKPEDENKQKQLQMMIAVWLLKSSEQNIKEVIQLTTETSLIKIEDILPYFTENIKLEHFKNEICDSLRNYDDEVTKLKHMMQLYQQNQDNLKQELKMINNKYTTVPKSKKCEECFQLLFEEQFITFDCFHCFHKICLWEHLRDNSIQKEKIERLLELHIQIQNQDKKKSLTDDDGFLSFLKSKEPQKSSLPNRKLLVNMEKEYNELLSQECPYCGPSIVETICVILDDNQDISTTWQV